MAEEGPQEISMPDFASLNAYVDHTQEMMTTALDELRASTGADDDKTKQQLDRLQVGIDVLAEMFKLLDHSIDQILFTLRDMIIDGQQESNYLDNDKKLTERALKIREEALSKMREME